MKNVYDIKQERNLNYILPTTHSIGQNSKANVLIIVHLYYLDTVNVYLRHLEAVPDNIDVIFTVSDIAMSEILLQSPIYENGNCRIIEKQNRGRDVSSFMVACRKEILKYDYVCFLHDKKEKSSADKKDTEEWIRSLWENMVGSSSYINNILTTFDENPDLGLLVPPFPMSGHFTTAYVNTWFDNFERTRKLAEAMGLVCNMDEAKPPITLGTVFWAKVPALKKMFDIPWEYTDFEEEPLKGDGTISHAIERIFAYVAQDAGYETGWVMTDNYAAERFEFVQDILRKVFNLLNRSADILHIEELNRIVKTLEFTDKYKKFYIYGAGIRGQKCLETLKKFGKEPDAFLVSDINSNPSNIQGIPVFALDEIELNPYCGIIVGVSEQFQKEVQQTIERKFPQFTNMYVYS